MSTTVVALHGFTRAPHNLTRLADAINDAGLDCVRPMLAPRWMPALYMSRANLRSLARRLVDGGITSAVLIGHSAGAAAACYLAEYLGRIGVQVRGVVIVEGVDSPNRLIASSLPALAGVPVAAILAPASPCNRHGALEKWLLDHPRVQMTMVVGAGHGDIEGAGLTIYRRACGDRSDAKTADVVLRAVVDSVVSFATA